MTQKLILEEDKKLLKELIGTKILYAVLPDVIINNCSYSGIPEICDLNDVVYFHSEPINLRLKVGANQYDWMTISPRSDLNITPWVPIEIKKLDKPDLICRYGTIEHSDGWILEEIQIDERPARLELFSNSFIKHFEILRYGAYASVICTHEDNSAWMVYLEYDRNCWLTFDKRVVKTFREINDESIIL